MAHLIPKLVYGTPETVITFTYPPAQDQGEQYDAKETTTTALDGTRWTKVDYIEVKRKITLSFLTDNQAAALREFYLEHASKGFFFKWFEDKDEPGFVEYQLDKNALSTLKVVPVGPNDFLWSLTLEFRRVY